MQHKLASVLGLALSLLIGAVTPATASDHDHRDEHHHGEGHHSPFEGMPLLMLMHHMQIYAHKLGLAIDAGNAELQHFYGHELEEVIEAVSEIDDYEGIPISQHLKAALMPAFTQLDAAIDGGEPTRINGAYHNLLAGCNACHQSSQRPYIVIKRNRANPYPQDFSPRD